MKLNLIVYSILLGTSGYMYKFADDNMKTDEDLATSTCAIPPSSITQDLSEFINNELGSDISFIVEGKKIYAHKIHLCVLIHLQAK